MQFLLALGLPLLFEGVKALVGAFSGGGSSRQEPPPPPPPPVEPPQTSNTEVTDTNTSKPNTGIYNRNWTPPVSSFGRTYAGSSDQGTSISLAPANSTNQHDVKIPAFSGGVSRITNSANNLGNMYTGLNNLFSGNSDSQDKLFELFNKRISSRDDGSPFSNMRKVL